MTTPAQAMLISDARRHLAIYESSRDLVELGAHQRGSNIALDMAIDLKPGIDAVLCQSPKDAYSRHEALAGLRLALEATRG